GGFGTASDRQPPEAELAASRDVFVIDATPSTYVTAGERPRHLKDRAQSLTNICCCSRTVRGAVPASQAGAIRSGFLPCSGTRCVGRGQELIEREPAQIGPLEFRQRRQRLQVFDDDALVFDDNEILAAELAEDPVDMWNAEPEGIGDQFLR